jgi:hypothetical protein
MNVWEIIEAIDDPSGLIHPERHQAFAQRTHPLARHPAYPDTPQAQGGAVNYEEILASRQWQKILQKAQQYLGVPLTRQALPLIQRKLVSAMALITQAEERYHDELEALAIELVFELPEFKAAKKAYESNRIAIEPNLTPETEGMDAGMKTSDEEQPEEGNPEEGEPPPQQPQRRGRTPAQEKYFQKQVQRRHLTNAFIQGSAVSNDFLFEMGGRTLDRIDPNLRKAYGILMVSSELGYWMFPQSAVLAGARAKTHIGSSHIEVRKEKPEEQPPGEEDQDLPPPPQQPPTRKPVVVASGFCLPVLIQEIIKGLTELASLSSLPRDPVERQQVLDKTDLTDLESWSMMLGPKLWDSFIEAIDAQNDRELAMHLYRHIQEMDVDEFNSFMKAVLAKSPQGIQMLRELAASIKQELGDQGGVQEAQQIIEHLLNEDED